MKCWMVCAVIIFSLFFINQNVNAQRMEFYPDIDTLIIKSGCTPPEIICSISEGSSFMDTVNIVAGFNTNLYSDELPGDNPWFLRAYFLVEDSLNENSYELWIEPDTSLSLLPKIIQFDTTIIWGDDIICRFFNLNLIVKNQESIIGSLSQFCRVDQGIRVEERTRANPTDLHILNNYPNPFNSSTTIEFQLDQSTFVNLTIFNMLGQQVITLVDEERSSGIHNIRWEPVSQPSGIYFARLQAGEYSKTIKLLYQR